MTFEEAKKFIHSYPKKSRWNVMGILYDKGILEQREYSVAEIAELLGISRIAVNKILNKALNKFKEELNKREVI
jgi:DNA-directed RNA polymerase specialized sigma subunit